MMRAGALRLDGVRTAPPTRLERLRLAELLQRLEAWLPREEAHLTLAREQNRPVHRREARWLDLVGLYERLARALGPEASAGGPLLRLAK